MRIVRLAALLVTVLSLSACTPPDEPVAGVSLRDGKPVIIFVACDRDLAVVDVYQDDPVAARPSPGDAASTAASDRNSFIAHQPDLVTEIPMFGPPPAGWRREDAGLAKLEPAIRYAVGGLSGRTAIPVSFTIDDLSRLEAGQVLTMKSHDEHSVVARSEFERLALDACHKR